jgi:hypothetical protein
MPELQELLAVVETGAVMEHLRAVGDKPEGLEVILEETLVLVVNLDLDYPQMQDGEEMVVVLAAAMAVTVVC